MEQILLQTLAFDLRIEHPYRHLLTIIKNLNRKKISPRSPPDEGSSLLKIFLLSIDQSAYWRKKKVPQEQSKSLLQTGWNVLNDSCHTTLSLQFKPDLLAVGALVIAKKYLKLNIELFTEKDETDAKAIESITLQILDLYEKRKQLKVSRACHQCDLPFSNKF